MIREEGLLFLEDSGKGNNASGYSAAESSDSPQERGTAYSMGIWKSMPKLIEFDRPVVYNSSRLLPLPVFGVGVTGALEIMDHKKSLNTFRRRIKFCQFTYHWPNLVIILSLLMLFF